MRSYATSKQLQQRRQRALDLLEKGQLVEQVAGKMGVTVRTVYRYCYCRKY